jgi:hypothetical protein
MVLFRIEISPSQFASMRKSDERAYMRGRRRRVMLTPALSAVDLAPRPRTITLSDWPLERRVIGQVSERADGLRTIIRIVGLMKKEENPAWIDVLRPLTQDYRYSDGTSAVDLDCVLNAARNDLGKIEFQDMEERREAAARAAKLPESRRLFGAMTAINTAGEIL